MPPLGLCMIASAMQDEFEVQVYDGVFDEGKMLGEKVKNFDPDFIGFSIRNIDDVVVDRPVFFIDKVISDFIQPVRKLTRVPIILGGSGFNMFPAELMKMTGADYGITGEGESLLPELIRQLTLGGDIAAMPNVISQSSANRPDFSRESNEISFSEIDSHIDFSPYRQRGVYSIQTKRGCSHGCIYCSYPVIEGRHYRIRKPSDIVDEMEQAVQRLGDITFEFVDSAFNDPPGHAENICREIIRRKMKIRMRTMGINPRNSGAELFMLMKEAGFTQIDATPDSASQVMLKNLGKGFTRKEIIQMAEEIRKVDLPTMWFFLFGGPGETEDTFNETLDFIDHYINPLDLVYLNYGLRVYPGTPLYHIALSEGRIREDQSLLYPPVFYFSDKLKKEKLREMIDQVAAERTNCIPSTATQPSPEMLREAGLMRQEKGLQEPMFRSLLRIRKIWKAEGKL